MNSLTREDHELPQATLGTPVHRSALERLWVPALGTSMHAAFFLMTVAVDLGADRRNRFSTTIQTRDTGKCGALVYLPKNRTRKEGAAARGVVVHLHGSGWTVGKPQFEHRAAQQMANELETVVVCPNYKKAPGHPFPFALYQMHAVLDWIASGGLSSLIKKHADLALDSTRIAVSGGSAGGNLAACLALLTQKMPLSNGAQIVALGLLYPHVDAATPFEEKLAAMQNSKEVTLPPWVSKFFLKAYLPRPRDLADPYVSPLRASPERLALFPPTVVVTASKDYLAREGDQFALALEKAGVQTRHVRCEGVAHAFDLEPALHKVQRERNRAATDQAWGTVMDVFGEALSA